MVGFGYCGWVLILRGWAGVVKFVYASGLVLWLISCLRWISGVVVCAGW